MAASPILRPATFTPGGLHGGHKANLAVSHRVNKPLNFTSMSKSPRKLEEWEELQRKVRRSVFLYKIQSSDPSPHQPPLGAQGGTPPPPHTPSPPCARHPVRIARALAPPLPPPASPPPARQPAFPKSQNRAKKKGWGALGSRTFGSHDVILTRAGLSRPVRARVWMGMRRWRGQQGRGRAGRKGSQRWGRQLIYVMVMVQRCNHHPQ